MEQPTRPSSVMDSGSASIKVMAPLSPSSGLKLALKDFKLKPLLVAERSNPADRICASFLVNSARRRCRLNPALASVVCANVSAASEQTGLPMDLRAWIRWGRFIVAFLILVVAAMFGIGERVQSPARAVFRILRRASRCCLIRIVRIFITLSALANWG